MKQSTSWEANNSHTSNQEIPYFYGTKNFIPVYKTAHVLHLKCFDGGKFDFILNLVGRDMLVYMRFSYNPENRHQRQVTVILPDWENSVEIMYVCMVIYLQEICSFCYDNILDYTVGPKIFFIDEHHRSFTSRQQEQA